MPTGVTVSSDGRIFVNFPRWGDEVVYTVAEVKGGKTLPYPNALMNASDPGRPAETLLSVQSVVIDPSGRRLWILDTGTGFGPLRTGGAKLVGVDLASDRVFKTLPIPPEMIEGKDVYLNDVRFDLKRGKQGMAFITDSRARGIIVMDLASGHVWRRLQHHPSTAPAPGYVAVVEGAVLVRKETPFLVGSDGIAISPDGLWLYYTPLSGRHLFRVSADALADPLLSEAKVAATVEDLGEKGGAGDGLEADAQGRIYLTDYEHNSIHRRKVDGSLETLVHDPRLLWPDTLSLAADGYLYVTANQLHRLPDFHSRDLRQKPYSLFRIKIDGTRICQKSVAP
jgi:sugar lactone lactonase YvrE